MNKRADFYNDLDNLYNISLSFVLERSIILFKKLKLQKVALCSIVLHNKQQGGIY
ncbi:MAG: hypothetical protein PHR39_08760 [Actinomycetota bacterium]|nr:hypothetical protein [Actinomycetota bacterium]